MYANSLADLTRTWKQDFWDDNTSFVKKLQSVKLDHAHLSEQYETCLHKDAEIYRKAVIEWCKASLQKDAVESKWALRMQILGVCC